MKTKTKTTTTTPSNRLNNSAKLRIISTYWLFDLKFFHYTHICFSLCLLIDMISSIDKNKRILFLSTNGLFGIHSNHNIIIIHIRHQKNDDNIYVYILYTYIYLCIYYYILYIYIECAKRLFRYFYVSPFARETSDCAADMLLSLVPMCLCVSMHVYI